VQTEAETEAESQTEKMTEDERDRKRQRKKETEKETGEEPCFSLFLHSGLCTHICLRAQSFGEGRDKEQKEKCEVRLS